MANPHGHVVSIEYDQSIDNPFIRRTALVRVDRGVSCPRCAAGKGCGGGLLGSTSEERQVAAIVPASLDLVVGDSVGLVLEPQNVLRAALLVYGVPLICGVGAALIAYGLGLEDGGAASSALGGLLVGLTAVRARLGRRRCLREFTPVVAPHVAE